MRDEICFKKNKLSFFLICTIEVKPINKQSELFITLHKNKHPCTTLKATPYSCNQVWVTQWQSELAFMNFLSAVFTATPNKHIIAWHEEWVHWGLSVFFKKAHIKCNTISSPFEVHQMAHMIYSWQLYAYRKTFKR